MLFNATEFNIGEKEIAPTGTVLTFMADTLAEAVEHCLYTLRLKNAKAKVGPTGRCVHNGFGQSYALTPAKRN